MQYHMPSRASVQWASRWCFNTLKPCNTTRPERLQIHPRRARCPQCVCTNTPIASLRRRFPNNAPYQSNKRPTQSTRQNKHPSECTPSLSDRGASHHEINTLPYPQRANKRWREEIMITDNHAAEAPRRTDTAAERLRIDLNPCVINKHNEEDQTHSRAATKSANRKLPKG